MSVRPRQQGTGTDGVQGGGRSSSVSLTTYLLAPMSMSSKSYRKQGVWEILDLNLQVVRDVGGAASEQYEQSLYGSVSCGAHLTTTKTTEAVTNIIRQLCLANKYEQITLVAQYLERLKLCPFSPKEVIALIENVAKHIPDTGTAGTIYDFVYDNIRLQGPRLITCLVFPNLFTKAGPLSRVTSILAKGIAAQTTFIKTNSGVIFARCINPVSISACVAKCGPDDKAPVKF
jgi:hypothetical protein